MIKPLKSIRLLLVDDEEIVRYALKSIMRSEPTVQVVGEACNGEEAIVQAQELKPDVILMDVGMPLMDGVTATEAICQLQQNIKVLILTTRDDSASLVEAMQKGAVGYLLKNTPPEDFIQAIQSAHKGYMQLGPGLGHVFRQQLKPQNPEKKPKRLEGITPRENDVLQLIAKGANNREISEMLHIAEKTVKNHVSNILSRVGLRDRTQLAIWVNTTNVKNPVSSLLNHALDLSTADIAI